MIPDTRAPQTRPIVVIVSKQRLTGSINGSSAYLIALVQSIRNTGYAVHLIQPSPSIAGRMPFLRLQPEMSVFDRHVIRDAIKLGDVFIFTNAAIWFSAVAGTVKKLARRIGLRGDWTLDRPAPYAVATPWLAQDIAFLNAHLPHDLPVMIADYMFCASAFDHAPAGTATGIVMHDLFHARAGEGQDSVALVSRDEEIARLARADVVLAIQEAEQHFVAENVPDTLAILTPMPAQPVSTAYPGQRDRLLFVGSNTAPNSVGLAWFLSEVWPIVRELHPSAQLDVAGTVVRGMDNRSDPGVRYLGIVPDLAPLYRDAGIVISPLTFGSGLKIKLVEGLAQGKAMVVSGVTLQGVESLCEDAVMRADTLQAFADAIGTLIENDDLRADLAQRALTCAETSFSAKAVHQPLRRWLEVARREPSR